MVLSCKAPGERHTMSNVMTCGQATVALLEDYGIDTAFGIPGVHTIEFYRGLGERNLRHVLTRHEQGAGFMADGYARATGRPAACLLITGPGVTNAATAIAQAYSDSQPMMVVSSHNLRREIGKGWGPFHEVPNQNRITEQMTALTGTAMTPDDVPELMAQAWSVMMSGRPRPVHIEIPRDVLAEPVNARWTAATAVARPGANSALIQQAAAALASATRPVILAGGGASDASETVRKLAELLGAPVATSFAGKGIYPEDDPLALGATLCLAPVRDFVAKADMVLAVGTELSNVDASNQRLTIGGKLIRVDIDPRKMNDFYPADIAITADAGSALDELFQALGEEPAAARVDRATIINEVRALRAETTSFGGSRAPEHRAVMKTLGASLPDDTIFVGDMTQLAYTANVTFNRHHPRTWLHPAAYATLGFALPAAIGASLGRPGTPVVSIAGDCGFQFTCQEMGVASELKLPIIQILWNNQALGEIRDAMAGGDIEPVEVTGLNPDFQGLARAYCWHTERAESLDGLAESVAAAAARQGPSLIEVSEGGGDWAC